MLKLFVNAFKKDLKHPFGKFLVMKEAIIKNAILSLSIKRKDSSMQLSTLIFLYGSYTGTINKQFEKKIRVRFK